MEKAVKIAMRTATAMACAILALLPVPTLAQDFPDKPIRIIVGYAPGGINDVVARVVAERLTKTLGQPVVVENRPGAGGSIGPAFVAKAKPDGYTLLLGSITNIAMLPAAMKDLTYDSVKDFAPVAIVAASPSILVANPGFKANSVAELIAMAKEKPGVIPYASSGVGTSTQLNMELFSQMAGIKLQEIPYKGDSPGIVDLMGGQISVMMPALTSALPNIKAGSIKPIAISTPARSSLYPDVPTVSESGLPGYEFRIWVGVFAPAGTPRKIVDRLNADIVAMTKDPAFRERLAALGAEPMGGPPEQAADYVKTEVERWARVSKAAGIVPQ